VRIRCKGIEGRYRGAGKAPACHARSNASERVADRLPVGAMRTIGRLCREYGKHGSRWGWEHTFRWSGARDHDGLIPYRSCTLLHLGDRAEPPPAVSIRLCYRYNLYRKGTAVGR